MFWSHIKIALRVLVRHKKFSIINILGLAVGFAAFTLTSTVVRHETSYDAFFANSDRIFAVYTDFKPESGVGVTSNDGTVSGVAPLLPEFISSLEASARSLSRRQIFKTDDFPFYQVTRFVDPAFLDIFQLDYVHGSAKNALTSPNQIVLTQSAAQRFFGQENAIGKSLTLEDRFTLVVSAIVRDLPKNTHFRTSMVPKSIADPQFDILATMDMLRSLSGDNPDDDWQGMNLTDLTYVLLNDRANVKQAEAELAQLYQQHFPEEVKDFVAGLGLRPLVELSQYLWNALGMPVPMTVKIIGILILLIAILNYTLLANAQMIVRTREIGLRKSIGAKNHQLLAQFIIEAVIVATIAFIISAIMVEALLLWIRPAFGQDITILGPSPISQGLFFAATIVITGAAASLYPALRIARTPALACFSAAGFGTGKSALRNIMIGVQFFVAIVLGSAVLVVLMQNRHMQQSGSQFFLDQTLVVDTFGKMRSRTNRETLKTEILKLSSVESVSATSQPPYIQGQRWSDYTRVRGEGHDLQLLEIYGDEDILTTFNIPLIAGENFRHRPSNTTDQSLVDIVINESAAKRFGWDNPNDAVGEVLFYSDLSEEGKSHIIVGVAKDVNYLGFHNQIKPAVYIADPDWAVYLAVRVRAGQYERTAQDVEAIWHSIQPDLPVVTKPLRAYFDELFGLFSGVGSVIAPLAITALALSLFGLFGLTAYSIERRMREVAIRKVFGATSGQIVKLFSIQTCLPVLISAIIGAPLAYFAASAYLNFFPDRTGATLIYVGFVLVAVFLLSILAVAFQVLRSASFRPVTSLREL